MAGTQRLLAATVDEAAFITAVDGRMLYGNQALERLTVSAPSDYRLTQEDFGRVHFGKRDALQCVTRPVDCGDGEEGTTDGKATSFPGTDLIVLVADDEPVLRRSLTLMLASAGFTTLEAGDGLEAVELVRRRDDIAVILLDASMPIMGGVEAARQIRCLRAGLPIVMMSGHVQEPLVGIEMITKPFEPEALVELLCRVIEEA